MSVGRINQRRICLILALVMLLAGVCFAIVDSGFFAERYLRADRECQKEYTLTGTKNNSYLYSSKTVVEIDDGIVKEGVVINKTNVDNYKNIFFILLFVLLLTDVYKSYEIKKRFVRWFIVCLRPVWDLMICYIHLSDGENA